MPLVVEIVSEDLEARGLSSDDKGIYTGNRRWSVRFTQASWAAATDAEKDAVEGAAILAIPVVRYQSHPAYLPALARRVRAEIHGDPTEWKVTVEYSSAPFEARGDGSAGGSGAMTNSSQTPSAANDQTQKAHLRPPEISFGREQYSEVLEVDAITGNPVANGASDPYDPPLETNRSYLVFNLKFWRQPSWLTGAYFNFFDSVNDAAYTLLGISCAAKTLKVTNLDVKGVWETGEVAGAQTLTFYYEVSLALVYKPSTWRRKVLNAGKREKINVAGSNVMRLITDDTGNPVADPVPLTAAGVRVAVGGALNYQFWDEYIAMPFSGSPSLL